MLPGILVPSAEQKQSGRTHWVGSQSGALLGSVSTPVIKKETYNMKILLAKQLSQIWCDKIIIEKECLYIYKAFITTIFLKMILKEKETIFVKESLPN